MRCTPSPPRPHAALLSVCAPPQLQCLQRRISFYVVTCDGDMDVTVPSSSNRRGEIQRWRRVRSPASLS